MKIKKINKEIVFFLILIFLNIKFLNQIYYQYMNISQKKIEYTKIEKENSIKSIEIRKKLNETEDNIKIYTEETNKKYSEILNHSFLSLDDMKYKLFDLANKNNVSILNLDYKEEFKYEKILGINVELNIDGSIIDFKKFLIDIINLNKIINKNLYVYITNDEFIVKFTTYIIII